MYVLSSCCQQPRKLGLERPLPLSISLLSAVDLHATSAAMTRSKEPKGESLKAKAPKLHSNRLQYKLDVKMTNRSLLAWAVYLDILKDCPASLFLPNCGAQRCAWFRARIKEELTKTEEYRKERIILAGKEIWPPKTVRPVKDALNFLSMETQKVEQWARHFGITEQEPADMGYENPDVYYRVRLSEIQCTK